MERIGIAEAIIIANSTLNCAIADNSIFNGSVHFFAKNGQLLRTFLIYGNGMIDKKDFDNWLNFIRTDDKTRRYYATLHKR